MTDNACTPCAHLIDGDDCLREAMQRFYAEVLNIPAVGYSSGEAFLTGFTVATRGVVTLEVDLTKGGGQVRGDQVFDRMLLMGSHMPVIFLTAPFTNHVPRFVEMVTRRSHVSYFSKLEPLRLVHDQWLEYMKEEPALFSKAAHARSPGALQ